MGRHRRIKGKNRKKLKSVDPFNFKAKGQAELKAKAFNRAPKMDELDRQEFSRANREIAMLKQQAAVPSAEKHKRKRNRDRVAEETKKSGFKQRPFEGDYQFMDRIKRETHAKVQEQMLKVRFNMGGRDPRAIEGEMKELDAIEAEKKKRKAEKRAAATEALKVKKKKKKQKEEDDFEETDEEDAKDDEEAESSQDTKNKKASDAPAKSTKMDRKKRIRMLRAEKRDAEQRELLLNAREVIPFGERADAPPEFDVVHRKMLKPGFAKAGSKQLLLKAMLNPPPASDESVPQQSDKQKELDDEREKVIAAYRSLKKIRRQAQFMSSAAKEDV